MIPSLLTDTVTYDLDRAVHYALLWGLEGLELRRVGGVNDRVPYVNEQKLKLRIAESELPVVAVDPGAFGGQVEDRAAWLNEIAQLDETLALCRRVGSRRIVVSSFRSEGPDAFDAAAEALAMAGRKARAAGVRLCVLNEEGCAASTGSELAALLDAVAVDAVRAAWNPADAVVSGEDAAAGLQTLGSRVELVRCRNVGRVGGDPGNGWEPRPIDHGDVDWSEQVRRLVDAGFEGPLSLEVDVEPVAKQGLRGATELIRLLRTAARGDS